MPLPSVLKPCIDDAVARAALLIDQTLEVASEALELEQRTLTQAEDRQEYSALLRELAAQRPMWRVRFPQVLRKKIEEPPQPASHSRMRPSSLTLVDDSELMQGIEASRLTQELASLVEQPLAELDRLVSSAMRLDGVHPNANPLRPEVFAQALRATLSETASQPHWPGLWMRYTAVPLSEALFELYGSSIQMLRRADVEAASYRVVTGPAALGSSSRPAGLKSAPAPLQGEATPRRASNGGMSGFVELITQVLRGPLFSDFLAKGSAQAAQQLEPSYYARLDEELAEIEGMPDVAPPDPMALRALRHVPVVDRNVREVGTDSPLSPDAWGAYGAPRQRALVRTRLKKKAENVGQVMGVEVVRQLVEQVARDARLLAPVREAIVALEPSLARLALRSPRFFGDESNPARQLVARVAERSFKYNDEFGKPFESFFGGINEEFKALNAQGTLCDEQPFAAALERLEANWAKQDADDQREQARLLGALRFVERRQADADEIAWGMSQRSDLAGVPEPVQDFLYRRWSQVMAHARLEAGGHEIDPGGYGAVVSDLLWSVKPEIALRDPVRACELIPRVVVKLRQGMQMVGDDTPPEADPFFKALEQLHRPVLKLRAKHRKQVLDLPSVMPAEALAAQAHPAQPRHAEEFWLAPQELDVFGFEHAPHADAAPAGAQVHALPGAMLAASQADAQVAALHVDSWVDLFSRNEWFRARLTWASANGTLFMFVSHGGRAHSMTRRTLHKLVSNRLVRLVEDHEVVQHAIDTLARPVPQAMAA
ncbi:MAG: DUF1631 family protein [Burkholderiales bacterium]|nr:DUF1631 family protein [Burkholderiales bacterium]